MRATRQRLENNDSFRAGDTDKWGDIDIAIRFLATKSICSFAISIRLLSSRPDFDFSVN